MSPLSKRGIPDLFLAMGTPALLYPAPGIPWSYLMLILFANIFRLKFLSPAVLNNHSPTPPSVSQTYTSKRFLAKFWTSHTTQNVSLICSSTCYLFLRNKKISGSLELRGRIKRDNKLIKVDT